MPINGGGTTVPLDDIGDGASSYADDPPDSPEHRPPPSAPPSQPKAPVVEHGVIWISYTPSAQARHIGDNKGIRRERAIDIDVDPADSTDVVEWDGCTSSVNNHVVAHGAALPVVCVCWDRLVLPLRCAAIPRAAPAEVGLLLST